MQKHNQLSTKKIVLASLMAALTVVGSALRITMPINIGGTTSFHLGNILCALSGILLGPWMGGLAAGMGYSIYDMLNPLYIRDAWLTFLTKFVYGFLPGLVMQLWKKDWGVWKAAVASASGAVAYALLYLLMGYLETRIVEGVAHAGALVAVATKIPATVFNASVAIIFAPILAVAIRNALAKSRISLE